MKIVLSSSVEAAPLQGFGFHCLVSLRLSLHRKNIMSIGKDLPLLCSLTCPTPVMDVQCLSLSWVPKIAVSSDLASWGPLYSQGLCRAFSAANLCFLLPLAVCSCAMLAAATLICSPPAAPPYVVLGS